jgi:hypothetical protein
MKRFLDSYLELGKEIVLQSLEKRELLRGWK